MVTTEQRLRVIELRANGNSVQRIAKAVMLSKQTVTDIIREGREQVAALEALNLDKLYEAMKITNVERIKNLATLYARLRAEVEERDLSTLPTEKLVDLYLKTATQLDGAIVTPDLRSEKEQEEDKRERDLLSGFSAF